MKKAHGGAAIGAGMPTMLLSLPGPGAKCAVSGDRRRKAEQLTYALGIPLYLRNDGKITQSPPGERIEPPPAALPIPHTREPQAAAKV
jgi:hypothetical protein